MLYCECFTQNKVEDGFTMTVVTEGVKPRPGADDVVDTTFTKNKREKNHRF